MKTLIIIPARYASARLPGKPLADIKGKPMIQHVYERAAQGFSNVYVATEDTRIDTAVKNFGGRCLMTSETHPSGTDRCAEALEKAEEQTGEIFDIIINLQGDEPLIEYKQLKQPEQILKQPQTQIATLIKRIKNTNDLFDTGQPKAVVDARQNALYFSRTALPFVRDAEKKEWLQKHIFYKHIGLYAYKREILHEIVKLPSSPLELAEKLEQNRWLEHGYKIKCAETPYENFSIDTKNDLKKINRMI